VAGDLYLEPDPSAALGIGVEITCSRDLIRELVRREQEALL
jgi:hypothetical protein